MPLKNTISKVCVLAGIAPYMAMELCIFDLMPKDLPSFSRGFTAALIATTVCYPLDTIRSAIVVYEIASTKALSLHDPSQCCTSLKSCI